MFTEEQIRSALDDDQFAAVSAPAGNVLCTANAGAGKTRVLIYRILNMMRLGSPASSFIVLTFTNKAAKEMKERMEASGESMDGMLIGTFHSVAYKLLRTYYVRLGFSKYPKIIDQDDSHAMINRILTGWVKDRGYKTKKEASLDGYSLTADYISRLYSSSRNQKKGFESVLENFMENENIRGADARFAIKQQATEIVELYEKEKEKTNRIDFDDLMDLFLKMVQTPGIKSEISYRYTNIFVDEYQDINPVQDLVIKGLNKGVNRLTVIGDDAQSIYGFRGSCVSFIRDFKTEYSNASVFKIRHNYRSIDKIVDLALSVINKAADIQEQKEMIPAIIGGELDRPEFVACETGNDQVFEIVSRIKALHDRGVDYKDMAILVRNNSMTIPFEAPLIGNSIPYKVVGGVDFYRRREIKLAMSWMGLLVDPRDELAFKYVFNNLHIPSLGEKGVDKLYELYSSSGYDFSSLVHATGKFVNSDLYIDLVEAFLTGEQIAEDVFQHTEVDGHILCGVKNGSSFSDVFKPFFMYFDLHLGDIFSEKEKPVDRRSMIFDFNEVLGFTEFFEDLQETAALTSERNRNDDCVTISTIHRAKGLEWRAVFFANCADCFLPGPHKSDAEVEEDRRLTYVAITRAREYLMVSYSEWLFVNGQNQPCSGPSRFLDSDTRWEYRCGNQSFRRSWLRW